MKKIFFMKKWFAIMVAMMLLLTAGCSQNAGQKQKESENATPSATSENKVLPTEKGTATPIPEDNKNGENPQYPSVYLPTQLMDPSKLDPGENIYLDLLFAPIGWSKDGKLAYITGVDPGGAGYDVTGFFRWVIQDMTTGEILWETPHELEKELPSEFVENWNVDVKEVFQWVFEHLRKTHQVSLDQYGIKVDTSLQISKFPLSKDSTEIKAQITDMSYGEMYGIPNIVSQYKVVIDKDGAKKTCYEYTNEDDADLDVQLGGYIKSPDESVIAVVLCKVQRGWEGPPHPVRCRVVGCNLEN